MKSFRFISILALFMFSLTAVAYTPGSKPIRGTPKILEYGMEGPFYGFYLGNDLKGHVKTKLCEKENVCKEMIIKITPEVKAFLDGQEVPLAQFVMSKYQPVSLHFDTESHKLNRISWFSANFK